ncbi:MAG TPA: sugar ABC transporter permease [Fimbriimonas sp.]|nr:sugar ABC transporter permease [Fimbriimonas sp.]
MSTIQQRESRIGWLFVGPALAHLVIFALFPIVLTVGLSLVRWKLYQPAMTVVGWQNYQAALTDGPFLNSIWNSFKYAIMAVPTGMAVALFIAILLNQKIRGSAALRTMYYLPAISSGVAVAMVWIYVFLPEKGLLNTMLAQVGIGSVDFLGNANTALPALAFMSIWTGLGPKVVLYLAGLINIPVTLYEAAELDGAHGWRLFRFITLPMLLPTTVFVLVTSTISALQVFTPVYMMTKGGPEDATDVVGYHIYAEAWISFNTGLASAKSFILFLLIGLFAWAQFRMTKKQMEGHEG